MFRGSHLPRDLDGDLLAFGMTVLMALMIICIRRSRGAPALPIAALSSLAGSLVAAPLARLTEPSAPQIAELALFGITQPGHGLLLPTAGSRRLSASRVALVGGLACRSRRSGSGWPSARCEGHVAIAGGLAVVATVVLNTLLSDPEREARVARRSGEVTATNAA